MMTIEIIFFHAFLCPQIILDPSSDILKTSHVFLLGYEDMDSALDF